MTLSQAHREFLDRYDDFATDMALLFIQELEAQGHRATGKLIASVVAKVKVMLNNIELQLSHLDYGVVVNTGVSAENVQVNSTFINMLMGWIRIKKIAGGLDKTVRGVAYAMANKMRKEGIPTKGSYRFTSNGRRTMWIDYIYNRYKVEWTDTVSEMSVDYMNDSFDAILQQVAKSSSGFIQINTPTNGNRN